MIYYMSVSSGDLDKYRVRAKWGVPYQSVLTQIQAIHAYTTAHHLSIHHTPHTIPPHTHTIPPLGTPTSTNLQPHPKIFSKTISSQLKIFILLITHTKNIFLLILNVSNIISIAYHIHLTHTLQIYHTRNKHRGVWWPRW